MAIALKLGTVTKKVNSTLVPDATLWTNYDVTLKQDTSLEAPVFMLQASATTTPWEQVSCMAFTGSWI